MPLACAKIQLEVWYCAKVNAHAKGILGEKLTAAKYNVKGWSLHDYHILTINIQKLGADPESSIQNPASRTQHPVKLMHKIQFLPHTADISIQVEADTLEELYLASLLGMNQILRDGYCEQPPPSSIEREIVIRSVDATTLLIDFLSSALTHTYIERAIFCHLDIKEIGDHFIRAVLKGSHVEYFEDDIKAVTYHDAELIQTRNGKWKTPIVFDI
jgi:SHS2 domain-containing protein